MADATGALDLPQPGAVAWLDVSASTYSPAGNGAAAAAPAATSAASASAAPAAPGIAASGLATDATTRRRPGPGGPLGPLGLQIVPMHHARGPFFFKGARLRGTRCVWSASTLSGAELHRPARMNVPPPFDTNVQILCRVEAGGSVFDPIEPGAGTLRVHEPSDEIAEHFVANSHLYTLNVPLVAMGVDSATTRRMREHTFDLTQFQMQLLRGAVGLLLAGGDELSTASSLVGVDRYLASLAALLLRTAVHPAGGELAQIEQVRMRTDAIIYEQAADPTLTPAGIATQLNISLRQLYRAFSGVESPAARIRRRRLEHAAEILAGVSGPGHVERVAAQCGFVSAEYFSRAFRREFGMSPRAYRSAHRGPVSAGRRTDVERAELDRAELDRTELDRTELDHRELAPDGAGDAGHPRESAADGVEIIATG